MARYIDADIVHQEIDKIQVNLESNNDTIWKKNKPIYKGLCYARGIINEIPTADVVPRSEVDNWYHLYHSIKEELKQEKMYHRETEKLCDRYCIESQQAKKQVAREIFEEIEKYLFYHENIPNTVYKTIDKNIFTRIKEEYTEEK